MKTRQVLKDIHKIDKKILPILFANCLLKALEPFVLIFVSSKLVDSLLKGKSAREIFTLALIGAAAYAIVYFLSSISENYKMEITDYLNCKEKNLLIRGIFDLTFEDFTSKDYQKKISRHRQETEGMGGVYYEMVYQFCDFTSSIFTIIIGLISLGTFYPTLFKAVDIRVLGSAYFPLIVVAIFILLALALVKIRKNVEEKNEIDRSLYADKYKIYDFYMRIFSDYDRLKQIKIYDEKDFIKGQLQENFVDQGLKHDKKINIRTGISRGLNDLVLTGVDILFLLILAVKAIGGLFGIEALLIYKGAFAEIVEGVKVLIETIGYQKAIDPKIDILYDVINLKATKEKTFADHQENSTDYLIDAKNICFSYPDSKDLQLKNLNLQVKKGEKIAIVGANGSGKTTFINLLTGLYHPTAGDLYVNGTRPNLKDDKAKLGTVSQDFFLFSFMLGENIACRENYNGSQVQSALDKAGFNKDMDLTTYIYKDLYESGIDLSGGEAQKVALARALYKDGDLLLFDEPTSKLDPKAEMQVFESFKKVSADKTAIFVSHRMSACKFADRIAIFKDGSIIATGTHTDLLKENPIYQEMWQAQAKYYN